MQGECFYLSSQSFELLLHNNKSLKQTEQARNFSL